MIIYNLLRIILILIGFPYFFYKREFFIKRVFSYKRIKGKKEYIWINLSSVGEINAAEPLISKILDKRGEDILITVMTDTGMDVAVTKYGENRRVEILYFPLDFNFAIKKICKKLNIKMLILIETEIWPNLIKTVSKYANVVVVNGRISDKSIGKYMKLKFVLKGVLSKVTLFMMQSEVDKKRIVDIGADSKKVEVTGNIKFDIKFEDIKKEEIENIKNKFNTFNKKIIVAGSTREGEEEFMIKLFEKLENYFIFLVPRHINRCEEIENSILKGKEYIKYSKGINESNANIVLVDEMGILRKLYAVSDIAFVGGTIANIGGHSLLEPLYYGKMPIFGENIQNVKDIGNIIIENEIGVKCKNEEEFITGIKYIEKVQEEKKRDIENFFEKNRGVTDKTFKNIVDII